MQLRILGCSGGIGSGRHTTSFLLDDDILIDAGSGVTLLEHEQLVRIDHLFVTHAHLDHILSLPPLLDSTTGERDRPLVVHALPEVLAVLEAHLFNWRLWPDFREIPTPEAPFLAFAAVEIGRTVAIGGRSITPIPAYHTVPAAGYLLSSAGGSILFSGDTSSHEALWDIANATADLRHLIVETSFPNSLRRLADESRHYCPETLDADLARLHAPAQVWITHLKPGGEAQIMRELQTAAPGGRVPQALSQGQLLVVE